MLKLLDPLLDVEAQAWGGHEQVHDAMPLARKRYMQRGAVRPERGTCGADTSRYTIRCR